MGTEQLAYIYNKFTHRDCHCIHGYITVSLYIQQVYTEIAIAFMGTEQLAYIYKFTQRLPLLSWVHNS